MKTNFIYSSKFWTAIAAMGCVTYVQIYSMQLGVQMPPGFIVFIGTVAGVFNIAKTLQNVAFQNGNGKGVN